MRKYLRGWNLRLIGEQKEAKNKLVEIIHALDTIAESRLLSI